MYPARCPEERYKELHPTSIKNKRSRSDTNDSEYESLTVDTTFPIDIGDQLNNTNFLSSTSSICSTDDSYTVTTTQEDQCEKCVDRGELIKSLVNKVNNLVIQARKQVN